MEELSKVLPQDQRDRVDVTRFRILLTNKKDYQAAYKFAKQVTDKQKITQRCRMVTLGILPQVKMWSSAI